MTNKVEYSKFKFLGKLFYKKTSAYIELSDNDFNMSETVTISMSEFYPRYMGKFFIHDISKNNMGNTIVRLQKTFSSDDEKMQSEWLSRSVNEFFIEFKNFDQKIMLSDKRGGVLFKK